MMPTSSPCNTCLHERKQGHEPPCNKCAPESSANRWEPKVKGPLTSGEHITVDRNCTFHFAGTGGSGKPPVPELTDKSCDNCGINCSIHNSTCLACHEVWERTGELKEWIPKPREQEGFTRTMLKEHVESCCKEIVDLLNFKNKDYGVSDDAFANFRAAGERVLRPVLPTATTEELMWLSAFIYVQKHLQALEHTGMDGKEADSRLQDIAVYCLIMRAILKQAKGEQE